MEDAVIEDAGGELPLEDGLLIENVGSPGSVELSPYMHRSGADDNSVLLSVFSMLPSPVSASHQYVVETPASTVHSFCLKCFKCLCSETKIKCPHHNKLFWCSVCTDLNKLCVGILQGFCESSNFTGYSEQLQ